MKTLVLLASVAAFSFLATGCGATPAYSGKERGRQIARNWDYEFKQLNDDVDHILMLRGAGNLTIWHVQSND
jgi:hypothetical protein